MKTYRGDPRGFCGCVCLHNCNPMSHGGVTFHETRKVASGHQRRAVNSTGSGREERGPWQPCSSEQAAQIRAESGTQPSQAVLAGQLCSICKEDISRSVFAVGSMCPNCAAIEERSRREREQGFCPDCGTRLEPHPIGGHLACPMAGL